LVYGFKVSESFSNDLSAGASKRAELFQATSLFCATLWIQRYRMDLTVAARKSDIVKGRLRHLFIIFRSHGALKAAGNLKVLGQSKRNFLHETRIHPRSK
jgi:hypothetical protein